MKPSGRLTWAKAPSARPCGAGTNLGHPCSSRRNLPCPVGESAAPAFGGLGPGFSHGARPKPPPVAAGCGARGRHTVHTGQVPLGAAWLQQPAEKKLRAGVARPSPAAGCHSVSLRGPVAGGIHAAGRRPNPQAWTPALRFRRTMAGTVSRCTQFQSLGIWRAACFTGFSPCFCPKAGQPGLILRQQATFTPSKAASSLCFVTKQQCFVTEQL